ncbi:hypothetical protein [uncultured Desulfobacter sp.]|uniref:hypothetical protein n=1 Tax=uncultured Desulfobacter sp. TaxID=240139 RepID=UPI00259BB951|nr:hypothetical protein [uncultured Desulfobacter sp.]
MSTKALRTIIYHSSRIAILQATEIEIDVLVQSVARISKRGGEIAMTTTEKIRQEGRREGSYKTMVFLVRNAAKNGLPEETIARIANLDVTLVRKILNNKPVDIPLHLLTDNQ